MRATAAGTVVTLLIGGVAAVAVFGGNERGSAGRALRLRTQFSETSLRMLASAPWKRCAAIAILRKSPCLRG